MTIVKATVKGQILIPAPIRKKLCIVRGTRLRIYEEGSRILVDPVLPDAVETGQGMLTSGGRVLKALTEDRKTEARR
jgi:AbrB family looped-hinge helix DNA binding protein